MEDVEKIRDIVVDDDGNFRNVNEIIDELKNCGLSDKEIKEIVDEVRYEEREIQKDKRWLVDLPDDGYFAVRSIQKKSSSMYEFIGNHILVVDDEEIAGKLQENGYEIIDSTATCYHVEKNTTMTVILDDDEHYHPLVAGWLLYEID